MFSSAVFAQQGDPGAAERFRMKFGRSIAAEQSSQQKPSRTACDCCHGKHTS